MSEPSEIDRLLYQVWREHEGSKGTNPTFAKIREFHRRGLDRLIDGEVRVYLEKIGMVRARTERQ